MDRFNRRLHELIKEGWFLAEDAEEFRGAAQASEALWR
jgi:hypothetical protein